MLREETKNRYQFLAEKSVLRSTEYKQVCLMCSLLNESTNFNQICDVLIFRSRVRPII